MRKCKPRQDKICILQYWDYHKLSIFRVVLMLYSLYFISTFECFHPFRNQPCSDVFNLEIFWSTSQLVTHQSNACFLQKRKSWNEEWIKLNLLKVEWMCFSHIFPCLSCDEGQVAQIENQEVSKKFKVKKLTLRYRKVKMYIC